MKNRLEKVSRTWGIIASLLATLLVPIVLIFLGLRLLASSFFLDVEYRLPHFPEDEYGFTLEERLEYANECILYLTDKMDLDQLAALTFQDGSPLFNGRELSHLEDVKAVFEPAMNLGFGLTLVLFGLLLVAQRRSWQGDVIRGVKRGGWVAFVFVAAIGGFAGLSFLTFFESFHAIFFQGDSWRFLYSDTLIRLFPLRFWQDAVIYLLVFIALLGLLMGIALRPGKPKGS